jgi:hypothetical protein
LAKADDCHNHLKIKSRGGGYSSCWGNCCFFLCCHHASRGLVSIVVEMNGLLQVSPMTRADWRVDMKSTGRFFVAVWRDWPPQNTPRHAPCAGTASTTVWPVIFARVRPNICKRARAHTHTHTHAHTQARAHTHTRTHTHTDTHTHCYVRDVG